MVIVVTDTSNDVANDLMSHTTFRKYRRVHFNLIFVSNGNEYFIMICVLYLLLTIKKPVLY